MAILTATLDLSNAATYQYDSGNSWRSGRCGQGYWAHSSGSPKDPESRTGFASFPELAALKGTNITSISFTITYTGGSYYERPIVFYTSKYQTLNRSLAGSSHLGQRLGLITQGREQAITTAISGDFFTILKNYFETGNTALLINSGETTTAFASGTNLLSTNYLRITEWVITVEYNEDSKQTSGTFYSPYVKISGNKTDPYRRYRIEWSQTAVTGNNRTIHWDLYCEGYDPSAGANYYVKMWSLLVGLTTTDSVIESVSSPTIIVDKQYNTTANWSNKGSGKISSTSAELYKLNKIWGATGNRYPLAGCHIASGDFVISGSAPSFTFTWSAIHYDSSYAAETGSATYELATAIYTITFQADEATQGICRIPSITVKQGNSIKLPAEEDFIYTTFDAETLTLIPYEDRDYTLVYQLKEIRPLVAWVETLGNYEGDTCAPGAIYQPTRDIIFVAGSGPLTYINNSGADLPTLDNYTEEFASINITCTSAYEWDEQPNKIVTGKAIKNHEFQGWMWNEATGEIVNEDTDLSDLVGSVLYGVWAESRKGVAYSDLPIFEDQYDVPAGTPVALNLDVNGGNPIETPIIKNFLADRYFGGYTLVHDSGELVSSNTEFFEDAILYASYTGYDTGGPTFKLPKVYRQSHELVHWADSEGNTYSDRATIGPIYGDLDLTAIWRRAPSRAVAYIFTNKF